MRALLFVLGFACSSAAIGHPGETYVFGGAMVIDTNRNMAMYGPYMSQIVDCSTPQISCLHTNFVEIAVPKSCAPLRPGEIVHAYRSDFEVIGQVLLISRAGPNTERVFLLGERERPNSIIGYSPRGGVRTIVRYEGSPLRNLLAELKEAEAQGRLQQAYDALPLRNRMPLITFAPLFRCGSRL